MKPVTTPFRTGFLIFALFAVCSVHAQDSLVGKDRFPQFRGLSSLPGSGYGVTRTGRSSFSGAMTFSTPIGYSLGASTLVLVGGIISTDRSLPSVRPGSRDKSEGNSTLAGNFGLSLGDHGNFTFCGSFLSGVIDNSLGFQYSPKQDAAFQWSVGVQDIDGKGGSAGENIPGDDDSSMSIFGAGTWDLGNSTYVSAGWGTRRFNQGFASFSRNLNSRFKFVSEHDGFGLNYGLAFNFGPYRKQFSMSSDEVRTADATLFLGIAQNRYLTWSFALTF